MSQKWSDTLGTDSFSVTDAIGGPRGVIESLAPGLIFVVIFVLTGNLWWTVGSSAGLSVLFCAVRLGQRQPLTQALAGLIGVVIGVVWAVSSGRAENYFAWGLLTNAGYAASLLLSIVVRQPLGNWALTFLWDLPRSWMREGRGTGLYRRAVAVTWVWVAVFALRLGVQLPLYWAGAVAPLGVAKLVMGLPLFGLAAWFTWVLLRGRKPDSVSQPEADSAAPTQLSSEQTEPPAH